MIPAVPLIVRLALSGLCIFVSKAGFALAGWISPELAEGRKASVLPSSNREPTP